MRWYVLLVVAGCSSSAGNAGLDAATWQEAASADAPSSKSRPPPKPPPHAEAGAETSRDASTDARHEAESAADAGQEAMADGGAGVVVADAPREVSAAQAEAGREAASPPEAGDHDSAMADAHVDAPPTCHAGATRCDSYMSETCASSAWSWSEGSQACCFEPPGRLTHTTVSCTNFTPVMDVGAVYDSVTGLTWLEYATIGSVDASSCEFLCTGARAPTIAELLTLVIGPPNNGVSVCDPTDDQTAFPVSGTNPDGSFFASDGCVSFSTGTVEATCPIGGSVRCVY